MKINSSEFEKEKKYLDKTKSVISECIEKKTKEISKKITKKII